MILTMHDNSRRTDTTNDFSLETERQYGRPTFDIIYTGRTISVHGQNLNVDRIHISKVDALSKHVPWNHDQDLYTLA